MKTFINPQERNIPVNEFTYEGCRYSGIAVGLTFSVVSDGLANFLIEMFPQLIEASEVAPVADNEYCCSKCNKDCGSKYMKERHEKVCKAEPKGMAVILKPSYIFWNYKNLDRTQLTPDQLIPESVNSPQPEQVKTMTEQEASEPAPGKPGMDMIGRTMQRVTTDRDGISWYGEGTTDDTV
jgi:hypothetical protein